MLNVIANIIGVNRGGLTLAGQIIAGIIADGGTIYSKSCLNSAITAAEDQGQLRLAFTIIAAIEGDGGTVYSASCLYSSIN